MVRLNHTRMKTFLNIPDGLYRRVNQRAAAVRWRVSDIMAGFLRAGLRQSELARGRTLLAALPAFHMGRPRVDIADREQLERTMKPG